MVAKFRFRFRTQLSNAESLSGTKPVEITVVATNVFYARKMAARALDTDHVQLSLVAVHQLTD